MQAKLITKNDTYAFLINAGISRGFVVIPEFRVDILSETKDKHEKEIDLVWLKPRRPVKKLQGRLWHDHWKMIAAFEIDAYDVSINNEFERHMKDLPLIPNAMRDHTKLFCALYTSAFDRNGLKHPRGPDNYIEERRIIGSSRGVTVFSVGQIGWKRLLPRPST